MLRIRFGIPTVDNDFPRGVIDRPTEASPDLCAIHGVWTLVYHKSLVYDGLHCDISEPHADYTVQQRNHQTTGGYRQVGQSDRLLLSVSEAAHRLGIGKTLAYSLVIRGDLASVKIGNKVRRVPVFALDQFVQRQVERTANAGRGVARAS
jgi:excisionase family DNA binding protein